ncbi:MAG: zinc ribbon domain-containing protein [Coriobacteriia bacterium]|nr:zinc ribbon domain-containing protein [Coriobacteriia bacterium]
MPAYDYRCVTCDMTFEIVRSISDSSVVSCPTCGSETKRLFTPVGVHFKGSGFYNTDSRHSPAAPKPSVGQEKKEPAVTAGSSTTCDGGASCIGSGAAD